MFNNLNKIIKKYLLNINNLLDIKKIKKDVIPNKEEFLEKYCSNIYGHHTNNFDSITKIDLSNQNLTEIPIYLKHFKNLKELDLSNNHIENIPEWFETFSTLKELNLSSNKISDYKKLLILNKIPEIEKLNLYNNLLEEFNGSFLNSLSELDLSFNGLNNVENINGVYTLNLSKNNINSIENKNLSNISRMNLSHNNIVHFTTPSYIVHKDKYGEDIQGKPIETNDFKILKVLDLSYNKIQSIEILPENLHTLNLSNNEITIFKNNNLHRLKYLDLSYNKLKNFNLISNINFLNIQILKLSNNYFTDMNIFKNLYQIDQKKCKLKELDLSNNLFTKFIPFLSNDNLNSCSIKFKFQGNKFKYKLNDKNEFESFLNIVEECDIDLYEISDYQEYKKTILLKKENKDLIKRKKEEKLIELELKKIKKDNLLKFKSDNKTNIRNENDMNFGY